MAAIVICLMINLSDREIVCSRHQGAGDKSNVLGGQASDGRAGPFSNMLPQSARRVKVSGVRLTAQSYERGKPIIASLGPAKPIATLRAPHNRQQQGPETSASGITGSSLLSVGRLESRNERGTRKRFQLTCYLIALPKIAIEVPNGPPIRPFCQHASLPNMARETEISMLRSVRHC